MTDEGGVYPCDEPMATIHRAFDKDNALPDWTELTPSAKKAVLEQTLQDEALADLIEARSRLEKVYRNHETSEAVDDLLCPTIDSVRTMLRMQIERAAETEASGEESVV